MQTLSLVYSFLFSDADKKNDKTTHDRCLQRHLVLVTDQKLGNDVKTLLPQGKWKDGETLRQVIHINIVKMYCFIYLLDLYHEGSASFAF